MFWGLLCCHIDHALLEGSSSYGFTKFLHWFFRSLDHVLGILSWKHWRKLPYLTAFLKIFIYLKNNDSANLSVFTLNVADLVVLNFEFDLVPLFYFLKRKCYSLVCQNFPNSSCHFWKHKSNFASILSAIRHNFPILF